MNKDVIYIDVEDDITAIISKVKGSKEKIVALVPPKRIGVLQSAVNLRLLSRAAEQSKKRLVVITNNHALMSLAASAGLPVAKNLQSKPEIAPIAALEIDDGEDVIDGNELPVGDHARQAEDSVEALAAAPVVSSAQLAQPPKSGEITKPKAKSGVKVPNFNTFRKKLMLGILAGILSVGFLVWAIVFAPRATVVVSAKTSDSSVNAGVTVGDKLTTNLTKNSIKATKAAKSDKKTIDFMATGSKNVGEKAKGTVQFSTSDATTAIQGVTIPAGTALTDSNGNVFTTDSSVSIGPSNYTGTTVGITASEQGAKYNAASGSVSGAPDKVDASITDPTAGGTDKVVKVVTASDVQKAKQLLVEGESKEMRSELRDSFKDAKAIPDSYRVEYTDVTSTPDVGVESEGGNAVLSAAVEYSMLGVEDGELGKYLDAYLKKQMAKSENQRVYENGSKKAEFQDVENTKDGSELTLIATAKVGPRLDENEIKKQALGRKTGEIQEVMQAIQGVEAVDVKYFPFWVSSVPNDEKKVTIQFKVNGEE